MYELPIYVWLLVSVAVVGIPAATALVLRRGAVAAGIGRRRAGRVALLAALLLAGWGATSGLLAANGVYQQDSGEATPWFGAAFAGLLGLLLIASRLPVMRSILEAPGMPALLTLPHTIRAVGVVFVIVMALGDLPAVFALPAGLGDLAIGVSAPAMARRLAKDRAWAEGTRFHLLGLLDLLVALAIGALGGLSPIRPFAISPSTEPLALLPLVLVPTLAVPLAIALHVVALQGLRRFRHGNDGVVYRPPRSMDRATGGLA